MLLGTGASRTNLPARYLNPTQYMGNEKARLAHFGTIDMPTATVNIKVDGFSKSMEVFVAREDAPLTLLGMDHPAVKARVKQRPLVDQGSDPVSIHAITRAGSQALDRERDENILADARHGSKPK